MTRIARLSVIALGLVLVSCASQTSQVGSAGVSVNPDFKVDQALADQGEDLFIAKGCRGCHTVGLGRASGPDLFGVVERRPLEWLTRFMKNTTEMIDNDPVAQALYVQFHKVRMPQIPLTDAEIGALAHYLQAATDARRTAAN